MWATLINNCTYSWLLITRTLANLNQNRFPLDFLHTFTVILPTVTWTLDNSNLLLTRSNFCFPSDHFYAVLPSLTWTIFLSMWQVETELSSKTLNLFQNNHVFLVFTFLWVQYKCTMFSAVLWSVHDTCATFLTNLIPLLLVYCFELLITYTFSNFPGRFELLRVDCSINLYIA